jgi:uncharacterized protein YcbK (DUF882 family)
MRRAPTAPAVRLAAFPSAPFDPSRRRALRLLGCGATAVGLMHAGAGHALASAPAATGTRRLVFHNTHTSETVRADFCIDGRYCSEGLARIDHVLRDHRSGDVHPIDRNLLDLLHDVATRAGRDAEFEVISGYRSPASNAMLHARSGGVARRSLHMDGRAIDVRLVGYDLAKLRDQALAMERGGVGYYRASQFVHLDTGRVRTWAG